MKKLIIFVAIAFLASSQVPVQAATTFKNCSQVNAKYPGGVAKSKNAKNLKTVNGKKKVVASQFPPKVDAKLYAQLKSMDRDADGIACEK